MMKETEQNNISELIFISLLFVLLLLNTLYRTKYEQFFTLGDISTTITFVLMFVLLLQSWIEKTTYTVSLNKIYLTFILLSSAYLVSFVTQQQLSALHTFRLMFFFLFILGSVCLKWNKNYLIISGSILSMATLFFLFHWVYSGIPLGGFKSVFRNENYLGVLLFCLLYFNIFSIKYHDGMMRLYFTFIMLSNFLLIFSTGSRSVMLAIMVILASWVVLKSFNHLYAKLFHVIMIGNLLFVGIYVGIKNTFIGNFLNNLSMSIFNKNLFSGRNEIWETVFQAILKQPFFGYGVGIRAPDVAATESTAHNMYLQVLLEVGLIGLLLFILFLFSIWHVLNKRLNHFAAKWSACFMLGILVYNNFELTLMLNNYSIAAFQWLIMTIGVSFTEKEFEKDMFI